MLRELSAELRLPEPLKAQVILEVAADMEAMFEQLCAEGVEERVAAEASDAEAPAAPSRPSAASRAESRPAGR